ncbi:MAG TPA: glycosyltransferase family 9 protein, partial [Chloroflexota bacterium]|nr:glycosyltransferase family 9 protein [Chloroflexota bacterium]
MIQPRADGRRLLLGALTRVLAARPAAPSARRKILVIRPDHLGDLLFLTPALRQVRRGLPDAEIVGLVGPWGRPVLERNPDLDRLLTWEFSWFDRKPRSSPLAPYRSLLMLAARLRAERFDLALQFRADFWWGALAVRLAGTPEQIGYAAPVVAPLLTRAVPIQHDRHAVEENLTLAAAVAPAISDIRLVFPLTADERGRAAELLAPLRAEADGRPIVALAAGAGARVKLWPPERLAAVGQTLRDEFGVDMVVLGGPGEGDLVSAVMAGLAPGALPLAGRTSLGELAAVLERCALVVGPDSGPLHLAVAVGTPSLHLYGPADARRFGPWGDPSWHRAIASPRPCAPCHRLDF